MFYTIQNGSILTAKNKQALSNFYDNVYELPTDYEEGKYITQDNKLVLNPDFEEKQAQKEKERIGNLKLTRGDVFRALYLAKQITRDDIRALIKNNELISEAQRELALIDFEEALNFYRGNTLIDTLGLALGITSEQLDQFFETNDYTTLLTSEGEVNE